jgi:hypothetical protein
MKTVAQLLSGGINSVAELQESLWFDLRRGSQICLPRITQPEAPAQLILHRLGWSLPEQPPPRIYRDQSRFVVTT